MLLGIKGMDMVMEREDLGISAAYVISYDLW
jgi:hypothetical protein